MYSRAALVAAVIIATSAPATLAAPVRLAPEESGALSWQDVEDFGNKVLDGVQKVTPIITDGLDIWNKVNGKGKREELVRELLARQESGALSWDDVKHIGSEVLNGAKKALPIVEAAAPIAAAFLKREDFEELVARAESGALSWDDVKKWGSDVVDGVSKVLPVISQGLDIYQKVTGKREDLARELHMIARDVIEAREVDASGAISWQDVKDFGKGFVQGFTKTAETVLPIVSAFVKREELDLIARAMSDAVVARHIEDMESGAVSWQDVKDFGKGFVDGFTKTVSAGLPIIGAFLKREEMELVSRQLSDMQELVARAQQQELESGALSWQDVKDFGKGFVQGFTKTLSAGLPIVASIVKREDDMGIVARTLNELD